MEGLPDTTEKRIALIARGGPYPEITQLLADLFKVWDYTTVLRGHPEAQQFIDGLYEVYFSHFSRELIHLAPPPRFLTIYPKGQKPVIGVFRNSGG
jgi:hypothetical protein